MLFFYKNKNFIQEYAQFHYLRQSYHCCFSTELKQLCLSAKSKVHTLPIYLSSPISSVYFLVMQPGLSFLKLESTKQNIVQKIHLIRIFRDKYCFQAFQLLYVQLLFTWNLSPIRPSKLSFEYFLLSPGKENLNKGPKK